MDNKLHSSVPRKLGAYRTKVRHISIRVKVLITHHITSSPQPQYPRIYFKITNTQYTELQIPDDA